MRAPWLFIMSAALILALPGILCASPVYPPNYLNMQVLVGDHYQDCVEDLAPGVYPARLTLNIAYPETGILGWEVKLTFEGLLMGNFQPNGLAVDAGTRVGEHIIGLSEPLEKKPGYSPTYILAEMDIVVPDPPVAGRVLASAIYFHSMPEAVACYLDGETFVAMFPMMGDSHVWNASYPPEMIMNVNDPDYTCTRIVASEPISWGGIKTIFR